VGAWFRSYNEGVLRATTASFIVCKPLVAVFINKCDVVVIYEPLTMVMPFGYIVPLTKGL
jgi:hypothetical protein